MCQLEGLAFELVIQSLCELDGFLVLCRLDAQILCELDGFLVLYELDA